MSPSTRLPTRRLPRALLGALVLATCAKVWLDAGLLQREARAQVPDAGAQRNELVKQAQRSNELLQAILERLDTGTLRVEVVVPDSSREPARTPSKEPTGGG